MIQRQWQTHPTDDRFTNWQTFLFYYCKCKKDKKFNLWFYFCLLLYDCTTSRHTLFLCLKKATCFYYTLAFSFLTLKICLSEGKSKSLHQHYPISCSFFSGNSSKVSVVFWCSINHFYSFWV